MENFTFWQTVGSIFAGISTTAVISLIVALIKLRKEIKDEKTGKIESANQQNVEQRKLNIAEDERNQKYSIQITESFRLRAIEAEAKLDEARAQVKKLELGQSVPSSMVTELYQAINSTGRALAKFEMMFIKGEPRAALEQQMDLVRKEYEALAHILP